MKKSKKAKKAKVRPIARVKRVKLPPDAILQVKVPEEHTALVVPLPAEGLIEIKPVAEVAVKRRRWWGF